MQYPTLMTPTKLELVLDTILELSDNKETQLKHLRCVLVNTYETGYRQAQRDMQSLSPKANFSE